jgi:hypothetical protein
MFPGFLYLTATTCNTMKQLISCLTALCIFTFAASGQVENSKWRGTLNVPQPTECIFEFKKDSLVLIVAANGEHVETMTYSVTKDTLNIKKLNGSSPCTGETIGKYRIQIKDEKLYFTPLTDDCEDRMHAFTSDPWIREKS